ncbi:helix-turn-helix domain-containing protein [Candidatus Micrarchaeota archaeon]|nr:helix-turn-helix domain-containing protein [Candidatus Micrarchaeota archaeon]
MEELKVKIAGEIALSKDVGSALKKWREIFGISQTELSEFLKISSSTISDYESSRRKSPGIAIVRRFVDAIFEMDAQKGGEITKKFKAAEETHTFFHVFNFPKPISANDLAKTIDAKPVFGKEKLGDLNLFGCTLLDSIKVILELPYENFMRIYSTTTQRALIFTGVATGRSPLVAVRVAPIKPAIIILHGITEVDKLAVKIAQSENIPLLTTTMDMEEIKKRLKAFEG